MRHLYLDLAQKLQANILRVNPGIVFAVNYCPLWSLRVNSYLKNTMLACLLFTAINSLLQVCFLKWTVCLPLLARISFHRIPRLKQPRTGYPITTHRTTLTLTSYFMDMFTVAQLCLFQCWKLQGNIPVWTRKLGSKGKSNMFTLES